MMTGCVVLPDYTVSSYDYQRIEESLRVKALETKIKRSRHVHDVGYKLLKSVPLHERKNQHYLGILLTPIDNYVAQLYDVGVDFDKLLVYGVVKDSPAEKAGMQNNDILVSIDSRKVINRNFDEIFKTMRAGNHYNLVIKRGDEFVELSVVPEEVRYNIPFMVSDSADVNAFASPEGITVMYGFLKFAETDDELAVVLAHELAHMIRGHLLKGSGVGLFSQILAIAIGQTDIPQAGDLGNVVGSAVNGGFSRNLEREADFFGILYSHKAGYDPEAGMSIWERFAIEMPQSMDSYFGSTHPTSTERLLRIKDIISKLKSGELREEDYLQ